MDNKKTCAIPERNTELSSPRDIVRRILFLLACAGFPIGVGLIAYGLVNHRLVAACVGGLLLGDSMVLWVLRKRWGARETIDEIKTNPYRPACRPKE